MKTLVNSFHFLLTTNDFDYKDELRPSAVLNYFQVVAGMHATEIGVGYEAFKERNLAWILTKIKYKCIQEPKPDLGIVVKTWPKEAKRVEYDRFYLIKDEEDNVLYKGLSRWCIIDFSTRRISREKAIFDGKYLEEDVQLIFDSEAIKKNNIDNLDYVFDYEVRLADLDHNNHMNNTRYGDIVLSTIDKGKHIDEFEINFNNECLLNDVISVYKNDLEDGRLFILGFNKTKDYVAFKVLVKFL